MSLNRCQTFKRLSTFIFGNFGKIHHSYAQLWFKQKGDLDDPTYLLFQEILSSSLSFSISPLQCFQPWNSLCQKKDTPSWYSSVGSAAQKWHCAGVRWDLPGSWQINTQCQVQHWGFSTEGWVTFWCSAGPSPWCLGWGALENLANVGEVFLSELTPALCFPWNYVSCQATWPSRVPV